MKPSFRSLLFVFAFVMFLSGANAQVDDICREFGTLPSLDSPFANVPYIYGRIVLKGYDAGAKFPRITVVLVDSQQSQKRLTIEKSGNYCFKRTGGSNGTLVVDVDGVEVARRSFGSFGPTQLREDFEIFPVQSTRPGTPGVVSAKFYHPQNEKTMELYRKAAEAEKNKDAEKTIGFIKEIVAIDPLDYIAWAKLGSLYFERNSLAESEAAFRKSLELKVEYTPAWINVGKIRLSQKQLEAAIAIFKHASEIEPTSARAFQLLGETYLQARQGTLGAAALNKAIRLDPDGMAECHLMLARLYDLAGAKQQAAREFKAFLLKAPNHADKKRFEKYIKENP
ncbi:MAG: tetratricopeptide repeat protein [Pyrinomonadaceae bacterium]